MTTSRSELQDRIRRSIEKRVGKVFAPDSEIDPTLFDANKAESAKETVTEIRRKPF